MSLFINSFSSLVIQAESQGNLVRGSKNWLSQFCLLMVEVMLESVKFEIEHS
jgi:hypothetical protein